MSIEQESKNQIELLKSEDKIVVSIGPHGGIFMQIKRINSYLKEYRSYQEALTHYKATNL